MSLLYGSAGVGKTNLCLWIVSKSSKPSLYLSTEGSIPIPLLERYSLCSREFYFREIFSLEDLSILLIEMFLDYSLSKFKNVCIDSINTHYRYEVVERPIANKLLNTSLAILSYTASSFGSRILLTAQVREEEGEVVPSGYEILDFWSDIIVEIKKKGNDREIEVVKPSEFRNRRIKFSITDRGIEFE
ncbi:MAG: hypothetical protein RMI56_06545 [Sulfolobales archaeon]|nr:hypothetical protein [Sulfolobales archaeon]MDW8083433.1 hypothetical protein [Sulfolobales archaeon]